MEAIPDWGHYFIVLHPKLPVYGYLCVCLVIIAVDKIVVIYTEYFWLKNCTLANIMQIAYTASFFVAKFPAHEWEDSSAMNPC